MEHLAIIGGLAVFAGLLWHGAVRRAHAYQTHLRFNLEAFCWLALPLASIGTMLPVTYGSVAALAVVVGSCVSAVSDRQTGYIFDVVIAGSACMVLLAKFVDGSVINALTGVALCGGALALLAAVTRGRGFAWGDVKLGALLGSLGLVPGFRVVGTAFVIGAASALFNIALRRLQFGESVPFAPYLAVAACAVVVCGAIAG